MPASSALCCRSLAALTLLAAAAVSPAAFGADAPRPNAQQVLATLPADGPHAQALTRLRRLVRQSLWRAEQARAAGNVRVAQQLDALARDYALAARELDRALSAETQAAKLQRQAADSASRLERTRALIEELVARRARARAELRQLQSSSDASTRDWADLVTRVNEPASAAPAPSNGGAR